MARDIKLNSSEWCEMVFEGRNKSYGAYALRKTSSKRHIVAFGVSVLFVGILAAIPSFLKAVKPEKLDLGQVDTSVVLSDLSKPEIPEENVVRQEIAPPPPPVRATIQFTPPAIVEDSKVNEEKEMKTNEEMLEKKNLQISIKTYESGSTDPNAIDPRELRENEVILEKKEPEKPFESVEQMPKFPGGDSELMKFIGNNLKYPTIDAENGIQGRVVLRFVVGKDGNVSDVTILRSLSPSSDKEAVRVVKSMPKWVPGMQNGRNVPVYFTLPVLFRLQN